MYFSNQEIGAYALTKNTLKNNSMVIVHGLLCLFQQIPLSWTRKYEI